MNKILLTGSTGFIGSELLKDLSQDNKVYVILRKKLKNNQRHKNVVQIYYNNYKNLNNKIKKLKIDTIIHCATHYVKSHNIQDLEKLSNSNILFGNIILENLKLMGVKKFINFSTVWENYDGKKGNFYNLYSAYKASFGNILDFYKKKFDKIEFLNLVISDTFGSNDQRKKIINLMKSNYKKNLITNIVSKKLYMNLLNVTDIKIAVRHILKKRHKSGTYSLQNKKNFKIEDIIKRINKNSNKKIKVKWLSSEIIKENIYKFKSLKNWNPKNSKIENIVKIITG